MCLMLCVKCCNYYQRRYMVHLLHMLAYFVSTLFAVYTCLIVNLLTVYGEVSSLQVIDLMV